MTSAGPRIYRWQSTAAESKETRKSRPPRAKRPGAAERLAFTLLEMLVALAVFLLLAMVLFSMISHVSHFWQRAEGLKERQQMARQVFQLMNHDLEGVVWPLPSSATNSFQFVENPGFSEYQNPTAAFWQTTSAGDTSRGDVSEVGYFVGRVNDASGLRSELRRFWVPSGSAAIFTTPDAWLTDAIVGANAPGTEVDSQQGLLAENVLGLWIALYDKTNGVIPNPYDSRLTAARPASVVVSLVLADSQIMKRIKNEGDISTSGSTNADTFLTNLTSAHPELSEGVQVFTTRINLEAAP